VKKAEILKHFQALKAAGPRKVKPTPVPYKHKGSTFDQDGIRILGLAVIRWLEQRALRLVIQTWNRLPRKS
jgi:hypothetical protein